MADCAEPFSLIHELPVLAYRFHGALVYQNETFLSISDRDEFAAEQWVWMLPESKGAQPPDCGSASKGGPRLVMLRYSKTVSKAARVVEIGVGRDPQSIFDSGFVPITCGRNGRGPALDADPQQFLQKCVPYTHKGGN